MSQLAPAWLQTHRQTDHRADGRGAVGGGRFPRRPVAGAPAGGGALAVLLVTLSVCRWSVGRSRWPCGGWSRRPFAVGCPTGPSSWCSWSAGAAVVAVAARCWPTRSRAGSSAAISNAFSSPSGGCVTTSATPSWSVSALGFAVIPVIFTIAEDACSAVPRSLVNASRALGATRWQTAVQAGGAGRQPRPLRGGHARSRARRRRDHDRPHGGGQHPDPRSLALQRHADHVGGDRGRDPRGAGGRDPFPGALPHRHPALRLHLRPHDRRRSGGQLSSRKRYARF